MPALSIGKTNGAHTNIVILQGMQIIKNTLDRIMARTTAKWAKEIAFGIYKQVCVFDDMMARFLLEFIHKCGNGLSLMNEGGWGKG